jgi:hypothetical protein
LIVIENALDQNDIDDNEEMEDLQESLLNHMHVLCSQPLLPGCCIQFKGSDLLNFIWMTIAAVVDDSLDNNNQTLEYHCSNPSKGMKSMQSLHKLHNCNFSFRFLHVYKFKMS